MYYNKKVDLLQIKFSDESRFIQGWLENSLDLNPIKNLWAIIKMFVGKNKPQRVMRYSFDHNINPNFSHFTKIFKCKPSFNTINDYEDVKQIIITEVLSGKYKT